MANPPNSVSMTLAYTKALFDLQIQLDAMEKEFASKQTQPGQLEKKVYDTFCEEIMQVRHIVANLKGSITLENLPVETHFPAHIAMKAERLKGKYTLFTGDTADLPAQVFQNNVPQIQQSAPVVEVQKDVPSAPKPFIAKTLNRVSFLLRNNNEQQALEEFKNLPEVVKRDVFGALWVVRGSPKDGDPIAHHNFGEVSFYNEDQRCASTPQQKACAVELAKIEHSIKEAISLLNANRFEEAKEIIIKLPSQIQRMIYGVHWKVCDEPRDGHPMAHHNFGEVSFLGQDQRCAVPCSKKAETLETYLPVFIQHAAVAQELTTTEVKEWKTINFTKKETLSGPEKLNKKISRSHAFAETVVKEFLGENAAFEVQNAQSNLKGIMADYVVKYPFLMPFMLQLENMLTFPDEKLEAENA